MRGETSSTVTKSKIYLRVMEIGLAPALSSGQIKREENTPVCKSGEMINILPLNILHELSPHLDTEKVQTISLPSESFYALQIKQEPDMRRLESFIFPQLEDIKEEAVEKDGLIIKEHSNLSPTSILTHQCEDVPQGLIPPIEMEDEECDTDCPETTNKSLNTKCRAVKAKLKTSISKNCTSMQKKMQKHMSHYGDKTNSKAEAYLHHRGEFCCTTCGKEFKRSDLLTDHMKVHRRKRPYPCDQCGMMFAKPAYLKIHLRRHSGERAFSCDQCDKKFFDKYDLRVHKRDHTGERPYMCQECGKSFKRIYILNKHQKTHSKERPFQCHVCGKAYKYGYCYRSHMKDHSA